MAADSGIKKLIILGAGSHGQEVLNIVNDINCESSQYEIIGFLDDDKNKFQKEFNGIPVMGPLKSISDYPDAYRVTAIQNINNFWESEKNLKDVFWDAERFVNLIHPTASISSQCHLGVNCVIFPQVTIGVNVRIGNHVNILPNSVINHDSNIGDYCILASGVCVSGRVSLGKQCYLGSGTTVIQDTVLGEQCMTGMGSVVLSDFPANSVVVGNPARFLRKKILEDQ